MNGVPEIQIDASDSAAMPVRFDRSWRSDCALKAILLELLVAMESHEPGVLQRTHEECLHDYRIAVRRSRSALSQIREVFPTAVTGRFGPRLAALGRISTPARDLDVYLADFDTLKLMLPEPFQDALAPLRTAIEREADWAYGQLSRHLTSSTHRQFMANWRRFLETQPAARPRPAQALMPIGELAQLRIWKLFRRTWKQGRAIKNGSPPESLHELRKTCKKLRYLLEFFRHLFPAERIEHPIKTLKRLQDYLGEYQDVQVQTHKLHALSLDMRKQASIPTDTLLAMGVLLDRLRQRETELRTDFGKRFKAFATVDHRTEYQLLLNRPPQADNDLMAVMEEAV